MEAIMLTTAILSIAFGSFFFVVGLKEKESKIIKWVQTIMGATLMILGLLLALSLGANAQAPNHESNDCITLKEGNLTSFEGLEVLGHIDYLMEFNDYVVELNDGSIMPLGEYRNLIVELNSPHIMRNWSNDAPKYSPEYKEEWLCINGRDTVDVNVYYAMPGHIIADYGRFGKLYNTKEQLREALLYVAEGGLQAYRDLLRNQKKIKK